MTHQNIRAAWTVDDLRADGTWIFELDDRARRDLAAAVRRAADPAKALLDYRREDFDLGSAWALIAASLREVRDGTGFAILRGMPRDGLTAEEFELLTWAIGLQTGVARPQGKASQFLAAVRDAGTGLPDRQGTRLFIKRRSRFPYRQRGHRPANLLQCRSVRRNEHGIQFGDRA